MRRLIKTKEEYQKTLREIESLMYAEFDTLSSDRLDALVTLLEFYEQEQFPFEDCACK